MERPSARNQLATYSFHHKALQEQFAAKYLMDIIKTKPDQLKNMFGNTGEENSKIIRVLIYVIEDLSANSPNHLRASWPQVWTAMKDAGADICLCKDLLPSLRNEPVAIKAVAETMRAQESTWVMMCDADVAAMALMLPYAQPRVLKVGEQASLDDLKAMSAVVQHRVGDLKLGFPMLNNVARDPLLAPLRNSRCRLQYFSGYIANQESVQNLASVSSPATTLKIGLLARLQLSPLQGKCKHLRVITRPFVGGGVLPVPLPSEPRPILEVGFIDCRSLVSVKRTVIALTPAGKRYGGLEVVGSFSSHELHQLVGALHRRGIRTGSNGSTRWEKEKDYARSHSLSETRDVKSWDAVVACDPARRLMVSQLPRTSSGWGRGEDGERG
ncbi:hypothetical protein FHG87_007302 [Trinorchestia longiramus]|nr:hypothetical protein FHG87_007302 [Trinorchestia longiramus]